MTAEPIARSRKLGPYITIGTVLVVLVAACLTLFGLGAFDRAVAVYDPAAWLFSKTKGELGRVNGGTAKVDTRVKVNGTAGHHIEVSQTDRYLIVRDTDTGMVSALDLTTLQIAASLQTTPGEGVRVVVHNHSAYVVDSVHGEVRQVDPLTLQPIGPTLNFAPGLRGGDFDNDGRMWLALPSEGTVVAVTPASGSGAAPEVKTQSITQPAHDLAVSVLDQGVAVLDQTDNQLVTIHDTTVTRTVLNLGDQGQVAARTSGSEIPVTVPADRHVYAIDKDKGNTVHDFTVPGSGDRLSPAVAWAGWYYVADDSAGVVYVMDGNGVLVDQIRFPGQTGDIQLEVRDKYLYINAVDGDSARVVDEGHHVSVVNKYPNDVLGGDPPPAPPTPPTPPTPPVGPPGAPTAVIASAGNTTAHLSWGPAPDNGSPVTKYVVEGAGKTTEVGANQRAMDFTGLTNGTTYTFTVYAVNAKGTGPKRASNPVIPTSEVPDAPASATAQEQKDGTVTVTWPAANGQGHQIASYQIAAIGPNGPVQSWTSAGAKTTFSTPAGALPYGSQVAFTVTTVNDKGGSSKPSPMSNSVTPYTVPGKPLSLTATTGTKAGTVSVRWGAPAANGRPISKYTVTYDGKTVDVTAGTTTTLSGIADGTQVNVSVVAVNAAGPSAAAGPVKATTIANPKVTITGHSTGYNTFAVSFTVDDGGGSLSCSLAVGGKSQPGNCTNITMSGLMPGTSYTATVTVKNAAGQATASVSGSTSAFGGTVRCVPPAGDTYCSGGIGIYSIPAQQDAYAVGRTYNGTRLPAYCKAVGGVNTAEGTNSTTLHASIYNNNKTSNMWVKISPSANKYIPWIWIQLDAGDDLNVLPDC